MRGCGGTSRLDRAQLAYDVLAGSMNPENDAAGETFCLARAWRFKRLRMRAEPHFDDAVEAEALVDSASDGFYFGQLGHLIILVDRGMRTGFRKRASLKRLPRGLKPNSVWSD